MRSAKANLLDVTGLTAGFGVVGSHTKLPDYEFEIIGEEQIYKRYLALSSRRIRLPATDTRPVR